MDSTYDVDVVISQQWGQIQALFNAVVVLIDLHPTPDEFASRYRERLADLSRVIDSIPQLMRAHGKEYSAEQHEWRQTGVREMSEVLVNRAVAQGSRG